MSDVMINIISAYYAFIIIFVGILASLLITVSDKEIYDIHKVFVSKSQFFKCVFMYQISVWEWLSKDINLAGMIILEILTTLSVWFLNLFILLFLVMILILKYICLLFCIIFKKK